MTTPTNSEHPADSSSDLPPLPPDAAPWQSAGYRDENARLLVSAIHRRRGALLIEFPDVPVQGYDVILPEEGPAGAITCSVLISLWRESELCRGTCPHCDGTALALAFGGTGESWFVVGVCPLCGSYVFRPSEKGALFAALAQSLEGWCFRLPTQSQLLLSNAHQHLALLAALRTLGEHLLPPDHYGFAASLPDAMRRWQSAAEQRIGIWSQRGAIIHAATGAHVEKNTATWPLLTDFVREFLLRTGTLPELDHAGPDGLDFSFPLSSQEPVSYRVEAPAADETPTNDVDYAADDDDDGEGSLQGLIDRLVTDWRAKRPIAESLARIQETLEESGDIHSGYDILGVFLGPKAMADAFAVIDDDVVRQALEITDRRVNQTQRIEFFEQHVLEGLLEDADVTRAFVPIVLESSDGESLQLVVGISGYSFTILEYEWHGPFEAEFDFAEWVRKEGWVETVEEFQQMGARRKAKLLG